MRRKPWLHRAAASAPAFDPATLALTLWLLDYPDATTWPGAASAGTSASQNLTTAGGGAKFTAGTALDGHATADANGTSQFMTPDDTLATYYDADGYGFGGLIDIDAITTNDATANGAIENDAIFAALTGYHAIYLRSNGGTPLIGISHYASGSTYDNATQSISTGAKAFFLCRFTGTHIQVRVNNTWGTAVATAGSLNATALTLGLRIARNYASQYLDAKQHEYWAMDFSPTDTDADNLYSYCKAEYPSAGLP